VLLLSLLPVVVLRSERKKGLGMVMLDRRSVFWG
jgi:hypothetical protein